ncbi:AAA family ATPase [Synechococcus sp. CS-1325]|uniref:AAA family ATPase n=1 Tax=Synechococcus sp. CS-1325 TaxID=2847979 RepID=UPI000DB406E6|nr:AAA family ATPase [Synechococcus sp. CS-1325]MCT0199075.1 AAA family ATPase [Synechococcus sp. CS-1325]PZU99504.1 MAG: restriction endonuclease [Cyanobium sp.]
MNPELLSWLQQQLPWLQVAAERLLRNGSLSESDIADLVVWIKASAPAEALPEPVILLAANVQPQAELRLLALGPIEGIDALNPRIPLGFGTGNLSVVYGHNGAGKTGYSRIIAKASGKPQAVDLRSSVFEDAPARQFCHVHYSIAGVPSEVDWIPPDPLPDLASIDIFDSSCGRIYLDTETEASFVPPELALLADLVAVCGRVDSVLGAEERALVRRLPIIPSEHEGTPAALSYGSLRHDWTEEQVASLTLWSEQEVTELGQLSATLEVSDPASAAQRRHGVKQQLDLLAASLVQALAQVTGAGLEVTRSLIRGAVEKRRIATEAAEALQSASDVNGVGSETWRALWTAAREFSIAVAYPDSEFPFIEEDARCVLCHQELDAFTRERLSKFDSYVTGRIETEAAEAEAALVSHLASIKTRPTSEILQTAAQAAELTEEQEVLLEIVWAELETFLRPLRDRTEPQAEAPPSSGVGELIRLLRQLASDAEASAISIMESSDPATRQAALTRRKELLAKRWISEQVAAIREEVQRLTRIQDYNNWKRQVSTTGISRKASELSETLVTDAYVQRFNHELWLLGASNLKVELARTRAERGRVKHKIRLTNTVGKGALISDILSEGERRIVSLAAFLADVTGRPISSPFIFDDPISSLDQGWEERVIDRLIAISEVRQVIIFTHRVSFLGIISSKASDLHDVNIRREPWGTGEPGEVPIFAKRPDRALNHLKNDRLVRARASLETEGAEVYYPMARAICSDFRILTERIVELVFLADVVQRHRRAVNTQGKIHQLSKIQVQDCDLVDAIMTKYSCYEHSQSYEAPVELPLPDELASDIDRLLDWHAEFKSRPV